MLTESREKDSETESFEEPKGGEVFEKDLENIINRHSIENKIDMPDFILANMISRIIDAIGPCVKRTLDWHGCDSICHPLPKGDPELVFAPESDISAKYHELLYAVEQKFPNESRHETALRYIRNAENGCCRAVGNIEKEN